VSKVRRGGLVCTSSTDARSRGGGGGGLFGIGVLARLSGPPQPPGYLFAEYYVMQVLSDMAREARDAM
jgi:hypothetical protein